MIELVSGEVGVEMEDLEQARLGTDEHDGGWVAIQARPIGWGQRCPEPRVSRMGFEEQRCW